MGQFLAIGLAHEIVASCDEMKTKNVSIKELRQEIEQTLLFDMTLYEETETDGCLVFTLKNQVLEKDLIPFLEVLYPIAYKDYGKDEYLKLLQELRTTPYTEWIDLADKKRYCAFQIDEYGESQYIRFPTESFFSKTIRLRFKTLMLCAGDGKIITEGIDNLLCFFKHCITETFKEYPIAKSMHIYITG